jgi:hypothetical protein
MRRIVIALGLICALPHAAAAQREGTIELVPTREHEHWFVSVGANLVPTHAEPFSNRFATPNRFLPSVDNIVGANYRPRGAFGTDIGIGMMATPRLGIGASRTKVRYDEIALHTNSLRPRLFQRGTLIYQDGVFSSSDQTSAHRVEEAYHVELSGVVVRGRHATIRAFAGPSRYELSQGLARRIDAADASVDEQNTVDANGWGYNAGADFSAYIPNSSTFAGIGFGTSIRYTRATIAGSDGLDPTQPQDYAIGAWHWSLGMRARF